MRRLATRVERTYFLAKVFQIALDLIFEFLLRALSAFELTLLKPFQIVPVDTNEGERTKLARYGELLSCLFIEHELRFGLSILLRATLREKRRSTFVSVH